MAMVGSLGGCTVLNSEYANGAGADTDGGSTSSGPVTGSRPTDPVPTTDSASGGATSSDSTASSLVTSASDTTDSDSHTAGTTEDDSHSGSDSEGTTGAETGDWPTSGSSEDGSSGGFTDTGGVGSGSVPGHVLLIYATTEPFNFPKLDPVQACTQNEPTAADDLCFDGFRYPLVTYDGLDVPAVLNLIDSAGLNLPVRGINGSGLPPIANSPIDMIDGLNVPLVQGGVNVDEGTVFWTGVESNCDEWTAEEGTGTVGSSTAVGAGWFNTDANACFAARRILCACESIDNPF